MDQDVHENLRLSAIKAKASRTKRANQIRTMVPGGSGAAKRFVYDCENTEELRKTLAREEGGMTTGDTDVDTIYEFAKVVRDYFIGLERNSIDNQGMDFNLNVHYGQNYPNAFWDGDEMTFGDGDGNIFTSFTQSLDVVAHEITHGVTQHTAALDYYRASLIITQVAPYTG